MRIDDSLKIATALLTGHMATTAIPTEEVMGLLHRWHRDIMRMQNGSYTDWVNELPPMDVLDQAEVEAQKVYVEPKIYPPPQHPLAQPEVSVEDKIAGTVFEDRIECLECGKGVKLLKSHLLTSHRRMTWDEYLDRQGLPEDYPAAPVAHRERQRADQKRIKGSTPASDDAGDQKKSPVVSADFRRREVSDASETTDNGEPGRTG